MQAESSEDASKIDETIAITPSNASSKDGSSDKPELASDEGGPAVSKPQDTASIGTQNSENGISTTTSKVNVATTDDRIVIDPPYRDPASRTKRPKGILKPAVAPPPRFNFSFRRDVLNYVNDSLSPIMQAGSSSSSPAQATHSQHHHQAHPSSIHHTPDTPYSATAKEAAQPHPSASSSSAGAVPSRSGAFWKRLGGAVTAVAANVPVPQAAARTLHSLTGSGSATGGVNSVTSGSESPLSPSTSSSSIQQASSSPSTTLLEHQQSFDSIKSVRFTMSSLSIVYPLASGQAPGSEASTRKRVNKEYKRKKVERREKGWTGDELARLYDECSRTREEPGIPSLRRLLSDSAQPPKTIDLKNQLLTKGAVEVLSDLLSVDFGLKSLNLENCGLDDESLKPLIHSLLVSATLPTLNLANNKRIRTKGWKLLCLFVRKSKHLKYLDISDNLIDRKIAEMLVAAFQNQQQQATLTDTLSNNTKSIGLGLANGHASHQADPHDITTSSTSNVHRPDGSDSEDLPPTWAAPLLSRTYSASTQTPTSTSLSSLRMESCSLKNPTLECLAHGIRNSEIKHVSLRRNRINNMGAVALAIMIRDYELSGYTPNSGTNTASSPLSTVGDTNPLFPAEHHSSASGVESNSGSPAVEQLHHPQTRPASNSVTARLEAAAAASANSYQYAVHRPAPPIPQHSSSSSTSRNIPMHIHASPTSSPRSASIDDTNDDGAESGHFPFGPDRNRGRVVLTSERDALRHAELKNRLKKQIESLPRVGALLTLDVRSNDIRGGVSYIAQVLKRNRTLKVLNLSDNRIDSQGLLSIAEALKYNSTLETLDLSNNPCCGPTLEGINTLRTAFAFNSSLKRIFLNNTDLSSSGAIALAEFLPDVQSLIHIDLADNPELDIAGIMALAASAKLNRTIRCLDLSIPPNDPEFARLSQDILQSCIRNTELAQEQSLAKGAKVPVAAPIYKSGLARDLKEIEQAQASALIAQSQSLSNWEDVIASARSCIDALSKMLDNEDRSLGLDSPRADYEARNSVLANAQTLEKQLFAALSKLDASDLSQRPALRNLHGQLVNLLSRAAPAELNGDDHSSLAVGEQALLSPLTPIRSPASPTQQLPSPSFSITSSDDSESDSADERGSKKGLTPPVSPRKARGRPASLELPPRTSAPLSSSPKSPVENQSRTLTLEEGEVFRRGASKIGEDGRKTLLDVLDDDEAGEELKQEILEVEVKRTRRTSLSLSDAENQLRESEQSAQHLHSDVAQPDI